MWWIVALANHELMPTPPEALVANLDYILNPFYQRGPGNLGIGWLLLASLRRAYSIENISNASPTGIAGHPRNMIFLTADALGVLPPIARLTYQQAMYHFLSGYTAKVAGTEKGLGQEPQAVFSACFGAPFMALHPRVYANLLGTKITRHQVKVWLVNTGWTGGCYGVGKRIPIQHTRAMLTAILNGYP